MGGSGFTGPLVKSYGSNSKNNKLFKVTCRGALFGGGGGSATCGDSLKWHGTNEAIGNDTEALLQYIDGGDPYG